ncbi:hypothetical protein JCM10908_000680 [Rhodotorula pacifica]|uniref:uncharacterized protein n=1 Tax=Rhodotorula pacifica TaxID=1495444 RepID=UPI00316B3E6F
MAPLAGLSGAGANGQTPQPAVDTRLHDVMRRWSATVKVDGKEAEMFKVEHQVGKTTCFIASVEGSEFEVVARRERYAGNDEAVWLTVDGKQVEGYAWRRDSALCSSTYSGWRISLEEIRPFLFAPIALTDDPDIAVKEEAVIKGLGSIQLDFYRVHHQGDQENTTAYSKVADNMAVDERSKKATMSHSTAYGPPKTAPAGRSARVSYIDPMGIPHYSLIFKYRSRTMEAPEPVPAVQDRGSSASESPAPDAGSRAGSSSSAAGKKTKKRKKIELTLPESDDENDDGGDLRAKIARLEAENAKLRSGVKAEPGVEVKKEKIKPEKVKVKVSEENGGSCWTCLRTECVRADATALERNPTGHDHALKRPGMSFLWGLFGGDAAGAQAPRREVQTRLQDALGRWSAAVKVEGKESEIFKVEHQERKTICYIVAEEGKEFEVVMKRLRPPATDESTWLSVDGQQISGRVAQSCSWVWMWEDLWNGKRTSSSAIRPFLFAPVAVTDDAKKAVRDEAIIKNMGTIRLDFYHVIYQGVYEADTAYFDQVKQHMLDEKCKNARTSHATAFGAPKVEQASKLTTRVHYVDKWDSPMYSLIFKYRSRALLEIEGIIEPLEPAHPAADKQDRGTCSTGPKAGTAASAASSTGQKKLGKRKKIEIKLSESDEEDEDGAALRAKIARLEAEVAQLRDNVPPQPGSRRQTKPKGDKKEEKGKVKVKKENGKVVLDLLDL